MPAGLEAYALTVMGLGIDAKTWCAYRVAALPGAVGRVPEIPVAAFALMVAGGVWLCLWRGRMRYLGLLAVLAGLLIAPQRWVPDLYVTRDGLVAVRRPDGRLTALSPRGATFELARILEHDGDGRCLDEVVAARGFRCDWSGCITQVKGVTVAISGHPASHADDCAVAGLLVALDARRRSSAGPVR
jgi:competence protein ComEC